VTEDFVTRLGHALRVAAEREQRRGVLARRAAAARSSVPPVTRTAIGAIGALAIAVVFAVYLATALRPEPARPPQVIAAVPVARGLGEITAAFDSAWMVDTRDQAVLRVDPATRRVIARIPLPGQLAIAAGADALWVSEDAGRGATLVRIDPRTNRPAARISLRTPAGRSFPAATLVAIGDSVWVVSVKHALRVDARTGRVTRLATLAPPGVGVRDVTAIDGDLWALRSDGRLARFDGATGARKAIFRSSFLDMPRVGGAHGPLLLADGNRLARIDPATGRPIWTAEVAHVGPAAMAKGLLWIAALDGDGERLVGIDPRDGRVASSADVGRHDSVSIAPVGREVWLAGSSGEVLVVRP
jgi:PQQ-like domain